MISIRDNIFDKLIIGLKTIKKNSGYNFDIRNVYDNVIDFSKIVEFPSINIIDEGEKCATGSVLKSGGGLLPIEMSLIFQCIINDVNNPKQFRSRILEDIKKYFGINYTISGSASQCLYKGASPWGIQATIPLIGIDIKYKILYRQSLSDPTTN